MADNDLQVSQNSAAGSPVFVLGKHRRAGQLRSLHPGSWRREQQKLVLLLVAPPTGLEQGSFLGQFCGKSAISSGSFWQVNIRDFSTY